MSSTIRTAGPVILHVEFKFVHHESRPQHTVHRLHHHQSPQQPQRRPRPNLAVILYTPALVYSYLTACSPDHRLRTDDVACVLQCLSFAKLGAPYSVRHHEANVRALRATHYDVHGPINKGGVVETTIFPSSSAALKQKNRNNAAKPHCISPANSTFSSASSNNSGQSFTGTTTTNNAPSTKYRQNNNTQADRLLYTTVHLDDEDYSYMFHSVTVRHTAFTVFFHPAFASASLNNNGDNNYQYNAAPAPALSAHDLTQKDVDFIELFLLMLTPGSQLPQVKFIDLMQRFKGQGIDLNLRQTHFNGIPGLAVVIGNSRPTTTNNSTRHPPNPNIAAQPPPMRPPPPVPPPPDYQQHEPPPLPPHRPTPLPALPIERLGDDSSSLATSIASSIPLTPRLPCYPGVSFVRRMKESGQAQVYIGEIDCDNDGVTGGPGIAIRRRTVAVKVFLEKDVNGTVFKRELKSLLAIPPHHNVVQALDFFSEPHPALVMEFVNGADLSDYLSDNGAFSVQDGVKLSIGIAAGLVHLHAQGVVHRDLKSGNIMRRSTDGSPVIIDLGLSSTLSREKQLLRHQHDEDNCTTLQPQRREKHIFESTHVFTHTTGIKGTIPWLSPEMIMDHEWSKRTDVFQFGIIMWEVFSGRFPYDIDTDSELTAMTLMVQISQGKRPNMDYIRHVDAWIQRLIQSCWANNPEDRPSMRKVLWELQRHDAQSLFDAADTNSNGMLSFAEFVSFVEKFREMKGLSEDESDNGCVAVDDGDKRKDKNNTVIDEDLMSDLYKTHKSERTGQMMFEDFKSILEKDRL